MVDNRTTMTGIDYLPYADRELQQTPGLREEVEALIASECKRRRDAEPFDAESFLVAQGFGNSRNEPLQDPAASTTGNEFLTSELQRVLKEGPAPAEGLLEDARYQTVGRPSDEASPEAWESAIKHNTLVLERLDNELMDVELQTEFGPSAWKIYAQTMEGLANRVKTRLQQVDADTNAINQTRKGSHVTAYEKERKLRNKWLEHIHQVRLIRQALAQTRVSSSSGEPSASASTVSSHAQPGDAGPRNGIHARSDAERAPDPKRRKT